MNQSSFPLIKEITIDSLANNCKYEFGIKKGDFEHTIFHGTRWLSRIRHSQAKMDDLHFKNLFELLKNNSGGNSASFIATMKRWYPLLSIYNNEDEILNIIKANLTGTVSVAPQMHSHTVSSKQFIKTCMEHDSPITCIKMAAQTGWRWFDDHERTELLTTLAKKQIPFQFIGNPTSPTMKMIARAMRDPSKELRYMGINSTLSKWHDYEKAYPSIQLRVTDYPILRQTLIVQFADNTSRALIRDYAYGSPVELVSPHKQVFQNNPDFVYYDTEFNFLWNNSQTYDQWYATLPEPEETLEPGNYILLYLSHANITEDDNKWIFSALSISGQNTASLKVNINERIESIDSAKYWEYSYQGNLKLTRNIIFISLYDDSQQEEINISLVRPLHAKDRFIGIMSALSPSGQPVAFKCACVGRSLLPRMDYRLLKKLLGHDNNEWGKDLLVIENQDINMFYSDRILSDKSR